MNDRYLEIWKSAAASGRYAPVDAAYALHPHVEIHHAGDCVEAAAREKRSMLLGSKLLAVYGQWQCEGEVRHLVAQHLVDPTPLLGWLAVESRDVR